MPTLEDTVDFKVATLNDLLDADVRTGVPVAADDKYKRWAFLSTGLAGMLLVALIVALVTGGGDDGGGSSTSSKEFAQPPNTRPVTVNAGTTLEEGIIPGAKVSLYDEGELISGDGTVLKVSETPVKVPKGAFSKSVRVAVPTAEAGAINSAISSGHRIKIVEGAQEKPTTTTAPPAGAAPTPIEPAPATTPTS